MMRRPINHRGERRTRRFPPGITTGSRFLHPAANSCGTREAKDEWKQ
jgi:hypothetical protein